MCGGRGTTPPHGSFLKLHEKHTNRQTNRTLESEEEASAWRGVGQRLVLASPRPVRLRGGRRAERAEDKRLRSDDLHLYDSQSTDSSHSSSAARLGATPQQPSVAGGGDHVHVIQPKEVKETGGGGGWSTREDHT